MAWERRNAAGTYYYRGRRGADGRVVKEYHGRGPQAVAAATAIAEREAESRRDRQAVEREAAALADLDRLGQELDAGVGLLLDAYLLSKGFHRQNYGPWRRRRGTESRKDIEGGRRG